MKNSHPVQRRLRPSLPSPHPTFLRDPLLEFGSLGAVIHVLPLSETSVAGGIQPAFLRNIRDQQMKVDMIRMMSSSSRHRRSPDPRVSRVPTDVVAVCRYHRSRVSDSHGVRTKHHVTISPIDDIRRIPESRHSGNRCYQVIGESRPRKGTISQSPRTCCGIEFL